MRMPQSMIFPVLWMADAGSFTFLPDDSLMNTTNTLTFKKGGLRSLRFVDAEGYEFIPASITKVKTLKWSIFLNHWIQVKYTFHPNPRKLAIDAFKKELVAGIQEGKHFYENIGYPEKLMAQINNATSFPELIALFNSENTAWLYEY